MVLLASRPLSPRGRCVLGRETAIERIVWKNDWPYVLEGKKIRTMIEAPSVAQQIHSKKSSLEYRFDGGELSKDFQSLRIPMNEEWCSLSARKGYLRLIGKESLNSFNQQSLIARRVQHFTIEVETQVDFNPQNLMQLAGLVFYYNTGHYHYANITANYAGTKNTSVSFRQTIIVCGFKMSLLMSPRQNIFGLGDFKWFFASFLLCP